MHRSEALKGLPVRPLAEFVDDCMAGVPRTQFDLAHDGNREKLRGWIMRLAEQVTRHNVEHFSDAAVRAIREMGELAVDPDLYATRRKAKERRAKVRAERREAQRIAAERVAAQPAKPPAQVRPVQKERK